MFSRSSPVFVYRTGLLQSAANKRTDREEDERRMRKTGGGDG